MSAGPKANYTGVEATAIADAFRLFVKTHQTLLDALIGVGGFITKIPFAGPPVAAVLRSVEKVVDVSCHSAFNVLYQDDFSDTLGRRLPWASLAHSRPALPLR